MAKGTTIEKKIENAILSYLSFLPGCFAWKNNTTGIYDPSTGRWRKSKNRFAINGVADILGVYKGRAIAIEVKAPGKKPTKDQVNFLEAFEKNGGIAGVARSVSEARKIIARVDEVSGSQAPQGSTADVAEISVREYDVVEFDMDEDYEEEEEEEEEYEEDHVFIYKPRRTTNDSTKRLSTSVQRGSKKRNSNGTQKVSLRPANGKRKDNSIR